MAGAGLYFWELLFLRIENPYNSLRQIANLPQRVYLEPLVEILNSIAIVLTRRADVKRRAIGYKIITLAKDVILYRKAVLSFGFTIHKRTIFQFANLHKINWFIQRLTKKFVRSQTIIKLPRVNWWTFLSAEYVKVKK